MWIQHHGGIICKGKCIHPSWGQKDQTKHCLVGGCNPFEKYAHQIGSSPQGGGENNKYLKPASNNIGVLIMVYHNPYKTGLSFPTKNQAFTMVIMLLESSTSPSRPPKIPLLQWHATFLRFSAAGRRLGIWNEINSREFNISHLGRRKIIFQMGFSGEMLLTKIRVPTCSEFIYLWILLNHAGRQTSKKIHRVRIKGL